MVAEPKKRRCKPRLRSALGLALLGLTSLGLALLVSACGGDKEVIVHLQVGKMPACPPPNKVVRMRSWVLSTLDEKGLSTEVSCTNVGKVEPVPIVIVDQLNRRGFVVRDLDLGGKSKRLMATGYGVVCDLRAPKHVLFCITTGLFSAKTTKPVSAVVSCGPFRCTNPPLP